MEILIKRQFNIKGVLKKIEDFVSTEYMMFVLACIVLSCHILSFDILGFALIAMYLVFVFLSNAKITASIPGLMFLLYCLSDGYGVTLVGGGYDAENLLVFLPLLIVLFVSVVMSAVYGIWKRGYKLTISVGFYGVIAMAISFFVGGVFSSDYSALTLLCGIMVGLDVCLFFIFFNFFKKEIEFDYIAKATIISTIIVMVELLNLCLTQGILEGEISKGQIVLGWGVSNSIAIMIAVGLPFTAYYMATTRYPIFYLFLLAMQTVCVIITLSRATLVLTVPFVVASCVYSLFRSKKIERIKLMVSAFVVIALFLYLVIEQWEFVAEKINFYLEVGFDDRGRLELYETALAGFFDSPLFGSGLTFGMGEDFDFVMVHNTVLQFMMAGGILGLLAVVLHIIITAITSLFKTNEKRIYMVMAVGVLFAHSMLDIVWFLPFCQIYYMLFINYIEKDYEQSLIKKL